VGDEILIEPGNPFDFDRGDLEELAAILGQIAETPTRVVMREERGYGVTAGEVLHVWLPEAETVADVAMLLGRLVDWARERLRREHEGHPGEPARSHYVDILGPDGKAISRVEIDDTVGRVVELPVKDHPPRRRPD
jgi:hypothetical protein